MVEQLQRCLDQVAVSKRFLREFVESLDTRQLAWKPGPKSWSVAECLDHLNLGIDQFLPLIDRVIEKGQHGGILSAGPFRYGWFNRWLLSTFEPPAKMKIPAPAAIVPQIVSVDKQKLMANSLARRDRYVETVTRANGLHLTKLRVQSPFSRLVKWDLGAALEMLAAHDRRHFWQAQRVTQLPGFPR
jgi:hypothetical protein